MRPGQKLHVYGFNWNKEAWFMHKMDSEQKIINRLFSGLDVTIHPTACDGMYTCHKLCDGLFYRIAKDGDKAVCEAKVCHKCCLGAHKLQVGSSPECFHSATAGCWQELWDSTGQMPVVA
jgi:hypothetical protein